MSVKSMITNDLPRVFLNVLLPERSERTFHEVILIVPINILIKCRNWGDYMGME